MPLNPTEHSAKRNPVMTSLKIAFKFARPTHSNTFANSVPNVKKWMRVLLSAHSPGEPSHAQLLPPEILVEIFKYLWSTFDLREVSRVCRSWRPCAEDAIRRLALEHPLACVSLPDAIRIYFGRGALPACLLRYNNDVWNLAVQYCRQNPGTHNAIFPFNAPDIIYNLLWQILHVDYQLRNIRIDKEKKISATDFTKLIKQDPNYPRGLFSKRVLNQIYEEIKRRPLLTHPHHRPLPIVSDAKGMLNLEDMGKPLVHFPVATIGERIRKSWRDLILMNSHHGHERRRVRYFWSRSGNWEWVWQ
ncbi:uncharacterized protein VTP21DRAFT_293 [Calcarisporiella thermophila]|uniref:uncharacterized protein n=1 Tax=Calcarisporiella thermophila TaxID=911321 RepID=UPI00374357BF